jgi:hypothetical protein
LQVLFYNLDDNKVYQWGNLFVKSKVASKSDSDMQEIKADDLFDGKEVMSISAKFKLAGAIVKH